MDGESSGTTLAQGTGDERAEKWAGLIAEQQRSGVSAAGFCRERQVAVWKFYWWRRRLSGEAAEGASAGGFVRVALSDGAQGLGPSGIAVRPRDGLVLIGRGFDRSTLREVLAAAAESQA